METPNSDVNKILERIAEEAKPAFEAAIVDLSGFFKEYSIKDVASSLFVSNLWLPNIASPVKHQFLVAIFATIKPDQFSNDDSIKKYNDFEVFLKKVYELTPSFPILEDFVPEPDWGEVKYYHDGKNYKIFFGNELSYVYEYLTLFQMLYEPYEDEYIRHVGDRPKMN